MDSRAVLFARVLAKTLLAREEEQARSVTPVDRAPNLDFSVRFRTIGGRLRLRCINSSRQRGLRKRRGLSGCGGADLRRSGAGGGARAEEHRAQSDACRERKLHSSSPITTEWLHQKPCTGLLIKAGAPLCIKRG